MGVKEKKIFYFFALAVTGTGISGGDRIFIELARYWSRKNEIIIYTSHEGRRLISKLHLKHKNIKIRVIDNEKFIPTPSINYIVKIIQGIKLGLVLRLSNPEVTALYSASEFWMDSFPAIILKLRYPNSKWIAAWYQTAPNPFKGFAEGKRNQKYRLSALYLWAMQLPVKPFIKTLADRVIVNNENERTTFTLLNKKGKVLVLIGAVRLDEIKKYVKKSTNKKIYEGVFQGRFHPQKGVVELIDIWRQVVKKVPDAKLAMIGDGPLMGKVKNKIKEHGLDSNIILFGYMFDSDKKYKIFSQSKVVVHPAFFDSGGMAAAEAMAFKLPCVGFDLSAYKSYYPHGMVKVPIGDINQFSKQIVNLLEDKKLYSKVAKDAIDMIQQNWSWEKRAEDIYEKL